VKDQPLENVVNNAKKMKRNEGTWVGIGTKVCEITMCHPHKSMKLNGDAAWDGAMRASMSSEHAQVQDCVGKDDRQSNLETACSQRCLARCDTDIDSEISSAKRATEKGEGLAKQGDKESAVFTCAAGMEGKVLCVNTQLLTSPELLWQRPHDEGYIGILAIHAKKHAEMQQSWLDVESAAKVRNVDACWLRRRTKFELADYASMHMRMHDKSLPLSQTQ
jgi:hypothetical protein